MWSFISYTMYTTAAFVSFVSLINRFSPPMEAMMCSSICVSYIFNFDYVFTFSVVLFVDENYSYIISQHLWTSLKQRCVAYYFKICPLNEHSQKSWTCTFWIVFALRPALLYDSVCASLCSNTFATIIAHSIPVSVLIRLQHTDVCLYVVRRRHTTV